MTNVTSIHQTATAALAAAIRAEQKRVANQCAVCKAAPGLVYADDEETPICGQCELDARKEEARR